ncbi:hypothetical protein BV898_14024 [Hypsibius exemplaris]|uniref:Peptidase M12A domain-containing protein n=1 Tax=Hypsibius exemplaris TaxID=2072580 RepID=A0A1W0W929_HYPEX|nr:hypothetical protein BV898_14024 [Hypsibius exemplaris]
MNGIAVLFLSALCAGSVKAAVLSANDPRYTNWPKLYATDSRTRIPVFIDSANYSTDTACVANIRTALAQMNTDLLGCIEFVEIPTLNTASLLGFDFLVISNTLGNGVKSDTCQTVPGRLAAQRANGQRMLIISSSTPAPAIAGAECCTKIRDIMRYLANVLGLRNEYNRADRPIIGNAANILPALIPYDLYKLYPTQNVTVYPGNTAFDYKSITMVPTDKYATAPGTAVWSLPAGSTATVGTLNRLSAIDCSAIAYKYQCSGYCVNPYP